LAQIPQANVNPLTVQSAQARTKQWHKALAPSSLSDKHDYPANKNPQNVKDDSYRL
jgi:hypothetical protein